MPQQIIHDPTKARAGTKTGVVRYILMISVALVIILFIVAYAFTT
jgi:hypothetical protein